MYHYLYQDSFQYLYMDNYKVKVIKMPYFNSEMSMLVFLPDTYNGINRLQTDMQSFNITKIVQQMKSYKVKLSLPKFTIDFDVDLKTELTKVTGK